MPRRSFWQRNGISSDSLTFKEMERVMKNKAIFDGRNQYDPKRLREQGWEYVGIGR